MIALAMDDRRAPMKEHEHATKNEPTKPAQDEVARKAYDIYLKEGRPQGRYVQNWLEAETKLEAKTKMSHAGPGHHAHMAADFRKRFWISLALTLPILVLSPLLQNLVGMREAIHFPGDLYALFCFASAVFWYGGWPFLKGFFTELKSPQPGNGRLFLISVFF